MTAKRILFIAAAALLAALQIACRQTGEVRLFVELAKDGKTEAAIVVPANASKTLVLAAEDLKKYLGRISGAEPAVVTPDRIAKEHKWLVALGMPEIKDALVKATGEFAEEEFAVKVVSYDERQTLAIVGGSDVAVQQGVYALLDRYFGVRFFHPRRELIPANANPMVGRTLYWRERPRFALRGMEPQMRSASSIFSKMFGEARHAAEAKEYIDYLAKNRQNVLVLTLPASLNLEKEETAAFYKDIFAHARVRGIKIMLRTSWDGSGGAWPLAKEPGGAEGDWQKTLERRAKILCDLGADIIDVNLGGERAPGAEGDTGVVEIIRMDELQKFLKKNYLNVILFRNSAGMKGLPPEGVGLTVETEFSHDLMTPFLRGDGAKTDSSREYEAIRVNAAERPVVFMPATSAEDGRGIDLPVPDPLFIWARSTDTQILTLYPVSGQIHKTYGLEWLYWLNDYAAMRCNVYPERMDWRAALSEYAGIFGDLKPVVENALMRLVFAHRRLQQQGQMDAYLWFWTKTFEPSRADAAKPLPVDINFISSLMPFINETERALKYLEESRDKAPEYAREWYDELLDTAALCYGNANLVGVAISVWELARVNNLLLEFAKKTRERALAVREIYERRVKAYRYPAEMYGPAGGYLNDLEFLWGKVLKES